MQSAASGTVHADTVRVRSQRKIGWCHVGGPYKKKKDAVFSLPFLHFIIIDQDATSFLSAFEVTSVRPQLHVNWRKTCIHRDTKFLISLRKLVETLCSLCTLLAKLKKYNPNIAKEDGIIATP